MALVSSSSAATAVAALPSNGLAGARSSFLGAAGKAAAASRASFAVRAAAPERPIWFPGSTPPPWLDGSLPGDFGFDPWGLGSDPESLRWNVQAELVHCRWADIIKPGCVNTDPIFPNNKLTGTDVGYPGGLWFDPLGYGTGSPEKLKELRTKEIKNGRLAMLAVMGAWFQAEYTGTGPIDNLFAHLADPGHATIFRAFAPK
ncbi:unnamed protein product [Triticum turgidum subsp. durum]|uniref:Chlorophyll a-b binding protein, chloroplastic n=1 Tax=Triticum turgidum subsp. durum TaxID=4567 RepID=A0A9R1R536_TRITD|nr:unnamed protein product [Triticum turgidum subsp. durum]